MNWLRTSAHSLYSWLAKRPSKARRSSIKPRRFVPRLEQLEDRTVPTVTFHGGNLLPNVEVQSLYYGANWNSDPNLFNQTGQFEGYTQYFVNSPYMDMLNAAGYNVGRGTWSGGKISLANLTQNSSVTDTTLRNTLQAYISNSTLTNTDANKLYVIYIEPNIEVTTSFGNSVSNFAGYHGAFAGTNASGQATTIRYAVIMTPGGTVGNGYAGGRTDLSQYNEMTMVVSHEVAEAVTDPDVGYSTLGWYDDNLNGEIGDIVNGQSVILNGYVVQKEPDKSDNAIVPAAVSVAGVSFKASAGVQFSGQVALVSDPTLLTAGSHLKAVIDWGDSSGTTTVNGLGDDGNGHFALNSSHTYSKAGSFGVKVTITDTTNSIVNKTETTTVTVGNDYSVADFKGYGVFRFSDATGWQQLSGADASQLKVDSNGDVVGVFSNGTYLYETASGWKLLTGATPYSVDVATGNGNWASGPLVVASYGNGVWRYADSKGWSQMGSTVANQVGIDAYGDVVADYYYAGVWRWFQTNSTTGSWTQLSSAYAYSIDIAGSAAYVVGSFSNGVWLYSGSSWIQLGSTSATQVAVDDGGNVAASYSSAGVWRYASGSGWAQLSGASPSGGIDIASDGSILGGFSNGVWRFRGGAWQQETGAYSYLTAIG
jgi:hypothetical protein